MRGKLLSAVFFLPIFFYATSLASPSLEKEHYSIRGKNVSVRFFLDNKREVIIEDCSYWDKKGNGRIEANEERNEIYQEALKIRRDYFESCVR